eukprot:CAMPEP_0197553468 /NCGR_PEP_ID=MMETSP1320-20131121/9069_1 /TAXON_ID=91990 /ORGANISM="Bolidomonas sp., Strain RCC2347" /LENGTH=284 /DNA_ID=CAMNT_0043114239 /DNA_START=103 /DNA_END=954 /DNA_ORIENTATION=-
MTSPESSEPVLSRSLNPASSANSVISAAIFEGAKSALMAAVPSGGLVYYFHKNTEFFRKSTGPSSRTALVIMPPLFMFALTSELEIIRLKRKEARDIQLAEERRINPNKVMDEKKAAVVTAESVRELNDAYTRNFGSPIRIKATMGIHHHVSNIVAGHPFKVLGLLAVPTVAYIAKEQMTAKNKDALKFSQKVMHTRVYGQFGTLMLLGVFMSWKMYHDKYGDFMSVEDAVWELSASARNEREFREKIDREFIKMKEKGVASRQRRAREIKEKEMKKKSVAAAA